jgi:hypothetical protein
MGLIIGGSFLCVPVFMAAQFSYPARTSLQCLPTGGFWQHAGGASADRPSAAALRPVVTVPVTFAPQLALAVVTTCYRRLRAAT